MTAQTPTPIPSSDTPMGVCMARWMDFLHGDLTALSAALHPDVVLHSPVLFTPQKGRDTVAMYLTAAAAAFVGFDPGGRGRPTRRRHHHHPPSGCRRVGRPVPIRP